MYTKDELEWALDHCGHYVKGSIKERTMKLKHIIDNSTMKERPGHAIIMEAYKDIRKHGSIMPVKVTETLKTK